MGAADWILAGVAALAILFAVRCYLELYRWAKQCQRAEIAIAYNKRVQLRAPLVEWLGWANSLMGDDASRGRVVYRNGKVTIAILRPRVPGRAARAIMRIRRRRSGSAPAGPRSVKIGV